ncbi:MAG: ABC transporter ATP-binding protein [Devosia sp.]|jgi:ABC-type glutathione transport system ATPase component|uniref:ABC transporter ATP-binding protein n=1 Tax=unclassified Devosia TaxID=196773 RepID=UPI0019E24FE9|nr:MULTISPECIES: ABC transporter ATP-binding protein [unclassified Devosia]MBF0679319.1 ABC transporter ATP-binding protein [Devosia sp.]WEJ34766.1 ABC transporter ATP-binding protein [Devosia sp. SD17-2]
MTFILKTEALNKVYRRGGIVGGKNIHALNDVNITVESDKPVVIAVVGESGSGKTTLAKTLLRLETPTSGRAIVYDDVVAGKGAIPSRKDFLGLVQPIFQNPFEAFSRYRPVDAYLLETARRVAGLDAAPAEAAVEVALKNVGLDYDEIRGKYTAQFSGGELQRISVARALIPQPKLIVADEPVSMIDASRRMIIINLFKRLRDDEGRSFVYITHDLATAYYISDFVAVMNKGRVVEFGPARKVMSDPQHDYTRLLLSSIPTTTSRWRERPRLVASN